MKFKQFIPIVAIISIMFWATGCDEDPTGGNGEIPDSTSVLLISNSLNNNEWIDTTFTKYIPGLKITTRYVDYTLSKQEGNMVSPEYMAMFDVVLAYENGLFDDAAGIGDSLYAYVMNGGNLVIGTFLWQDRSDGSFGRALGSFEMIDPVMGGDCRYTNDSLGVVNNHPLTTNIDGLIGYGYRGGPDSLRSNATAVAWWANGDILIGFNKPNGTITAITLFPAEPYYYPEALTEEFLQLWANAIYWTAWGETAGLAPNILLPAIDKPASRKMVNSPATGKSGTDGSLNR